jgi:hypothetical protein
MPLDPQGGCGCKWYDVIGSRRESPNAVIPWCVCIGASTHYGSKLFAALPVHLPIHSLVSFAWTHARFFLLEARSAFRFLALPNYQTYPTTQPYPTTNPTNRPANQPTPPPNHQPANHPTHQPNYQTYPTTGPTQLPTQQPNQPTCQPANPPTQPPTSQPPDPPTQGASQPSPN